MKTLFIFNPLNRSLDGRGKIVSNETQVLINACWDSIGGGFIGNKKADKFEKDVWWKSLHEKWSEKRLCKELQKWSAENAS